MAWINFECEYVFYFALQVWRSGLSLFLALSPLYSQWNLVGCFSGISQPRAPSFLSLFHQNRYDFAHKLLGALELLSACTINIYDKI